MKKYIDIDLAKESLLGWYPNLDDQQIEYMLDTIPAADVEEVKHGYWYDIDSDVGWELVGCSICSREYSLCDGEDRTDYCPRCGAKMDGGKAE